MWCRFAHCTKCKGVSVLCIIIPCTHCAHCRASGVVCVVTDYLLYTLYTLSKLKITSQNKVLGDICVVYLSTVHTVQHGLSVLWLIIHCTHCTLSVCCRFLHCTKCKEISVLCIIIHCTHCALTAPRVVCVVYLSTVHSVHTAHNWFYVL